MKMFFFRLGKFGKRGFYPETEIDQERKKPKNFRLYRKNYTSQLFPPEQFNISLHRIHDWNLELESISRFL